MMIMPLTIRPLEIMALVLVSGCTTLGPTPMVSGQSMALNPRTHVEVQAAAVPGFFLSSAATDPEGTPTQQVAGLFEPGDWLPLKGLSAGGRWVGGGDESGHFEPMIRYRTEIDEQQRVAVGLVGWGAMHEGSSAQASYEARRVALEVGADVRLTPKSRWVELHGMAALAGTWLDASGSYCANAEGKGIQCDFAGPPKAHAETSSVYPAGSAGLALDLGSRFESVFHGGRLFAMVGGGWMPKVRDGEPADRAVFHSLGGGLSLALGAP